MKNNTIFKLTEFLPYFFIGAIATVIDWSIFWVVVNLMNWHYEIALVIGFITAGLFHFTSNKIITFKCHSKQIGSQYTLYIIVAVIALLVSMAMMACWVNIFMLNKMWARIITTAVMLVPNYLLHKHITFSKKIFIQPDVLN